MKKASVILFLLLLTGCITCYGQHHNAAAGMDADGKSFVVSGTINGKPATFTLDTGAEFGIVLFKPAAERLGLTFPEVPTSRGQPNGKTLIRMTEPYDVSAFDITGKIPFAIVNTPVPADTDGCIGWPLFKNNVLQIDANGGVLRTLEEVPREARTWTSLRLRSNSGVLCLETTDTQGKGAILIDTGDTRNGVSLSPERWHEWTNSHPDRPKTLTESYSPGSGHLIGEESWAERLSLGAFTITRVPVTEAGRSQIALGCDAALGITALQRLELVVDGNEGVAYVRVRSGPSRPYYYNRAGAVFSPRDLMGSAANHLIAHVLPGSPAYEANIRDGDVVLKVGQQWYTNWTIGPTTLCSTRPAGTRVDLTLKRGDKTFSTTVVLRDIFPANATPATKE